MGRKSIAATALLEGPDAEAVKANVSKLTKDLKAASALMTAAEARYLVDTYYQIQEHRIALAAQMRELYKNAEPSQFFVWLTENLVLLEDQIKGALLKYAEAQEAGRWALSVCGIGPVLAAGLLAHIDPHKFNYVGSVMRFGGYDPTVTWKAKERRPWNAGLKVLFWKIGESFIKVQARSQDTYGKIYRKWKDVYIDRNDKGLYGERCEQILASKNFRKDTDTYKSYSLGKFPPAHVHAMARRKAVHMFVAHFCQVYWETTHNKPFPRPWIFEYGGHDYDASYEAPPKYTPVVREDNNEQ